MSRVDCLGIVRSAVQIAGAGLPDGSVQAVDGDTTDITAQCLFKRHHDLDGLFAVGDMPEADRRQDIGTAGMEMLSVGIRFCRSCSGIQR